MSVYLIIASKYTEKNRTAGRSRQIHNYNHISQRSSLSNWYNNRQKSGKIQNTQTVLLTSLTCWTFYEALHPTAAEYAFFSRVHEIFIKRDYILAVKQVSTNSRVSSHTKYILWQIAEISLESLQVCRN